MLRGKKRRISSAKPSSPPPPAQTLSLTLGLPGRYRVLRLETTRGESLTKGQEILTCTSVDRGIDSHLQVETLTSPHDGKLLEFAIKDGEEFEGNREIVKISFCLHDTVVFDVCAMCGCQVASVASLLSSNAAFNEEEGMTVNVQGGKKLKVTQAEAMRVKEASIKRLFADKRLSLVLDLDHTLLHCTDDAKAMSLAQTAPQRHRLHTFELDGLFFVLKLRPGLAKFLRTMGEKYEMYVYTAGTRAYAEHACSIIDPDGSMFGGRIVSRDDVPPELAKGKDLERLFPANTEMAVVVDDRNVWKSIPNLLTCEPFIFFQGMHDVNNAGWSAETLAENDDASSDDEAAAAAEDDEVLSSGVPEKSRSPPFASAAGFSIEDEMDSGLARVDSILKRVHREFYFPSTTLTLEDQLKGTGSDVKIIMTRIHGQILRNVNIAFDPSTEHVQQLYERAQQCGAKCTSQINADVTHFVTPGDTPLSKIAKTAGVSWIVKPGWVETCDHHWERVKEDTYVVARTRTRTNSVPGTFTGETAETMVDAPTAASREDDDDAILDFMKSIQSAEVVEGDEIVVQVEESDEVEVL